ncbi:MAG: hypothetical protein JO353_01040, partial [Phycisphaerae bacterium]|nr:hypothetical protein [Phycisphaerae bacterium]
MTLGVAKLKGNGIVDAWINWPDAPASPYIARQTYGCGCVTWVAQDLGDIALKRQVTENWPIVWNRIFDWKDQPMNATRISQDTRDSFTRETQGVDVARSLLDETDLPGKGLGLISLAVLSFIVYWAVAGPGAYFYLLAKQRTGASWFVFGATAIVFTCLSALLVRVVLRGPPALKHLSVARAAMNDAVHVYSRIGLYIPHDGERALSLSDAAAGSAPSLTAFAIAPTEMGDDQSDDIGQSYQVPIPEAIGSDSQVVRIPFRSTMKKLEASWTGPFSDNTLRGGIEGHVRRNPDSTTPDGQLTNNSGRTLHDVYIAYKWQASGNEYNALNGDYLFYLPAWGYGASLNLHADLTTEQDDQGNPRRVPFIDSSANYATGRGHKYWGMIQTNWAHYWMRGLSNFTTDPTVGFDQAIVMLSFFDRLPVDQLNGEHKTRFDFLRPGAHRFDASAALAAGSMVILARSDPRSPEGLPVPFAVDGQSTRGSGTTVYQFIVPVDNGDSTPPSTQPEAH